jgi:hypothetical protein
VKKNIKFLWTEKLIEPSIDSDNLCQQHTPRCRKYFLNKDTGQIFSCTDIDIKKKNRLDKLNLFNDAYYDLYENNKLSIISTVVNVDDYKVSEFLLFTKRKLLRHKIHILGYVNVLDSGSIKNKNHNHILIATTSISEEQLNDLMNDKDKKRFSSEFLKTKNGMKEYLHKKSIFNKTKGRSYSSSVRFKSLEELKQEVLKKKIKRVENKRKSIDKNSKNLKQSISKNLKENNEIKVVKLELKNTIISNSKIINKLTSKSKKTVNESFGYIGIKRKVKNDVLTTLFIQITSPNKAKINKLKVYGLMKFKIQNGFFDNDIKSLKRIVSYNSKILNSRKFKSIVKF